MTLPACLLALVLMMDVSTSVPDALYRAQRDGAAAAFEDPAFLRSIEASPGIAVLVAGFDDHAATQLGWRLIRDAGAARRFAAELRGVGRPGSAPSTSIGAAIAHGHAAMEEAPCVPEWEVIDISTDGFETAEHDPVRESRDAASARGVVINAIAFESPGDFGDDESLAGMMLQDSENWLRDNVATGFVRVARDPAGFGDAVRSKVIVEVTLRLAPS